MTPPPDADGGDARGFPAQEVAAADLRAALERGEIAEAGRLLDAAQTASSTGGDIWERVGIPAEEVIDGSVVSSMIGQVGDAGDGLAAVEALLTRLGSAAVDALLDALEAEEDTRTRATLLGITADVAPGHVEVVVQRLADRRWFVVRNALAILARTGGAPLAQVAGMADHDHPAVRREAGRALMTCGPPAVPALRRLAADPDRLTRVAAVVGLRSVGGRDAVDALVEVAAGDGPTDARRTALDGLAGLPEAAAGEALQRLSSRGGGHRLPWRLRRHARRMLRRRRAAGPGRSGPGDDMPDGT